MSGIKKLWSEIKYWFFILLFLGLLFEMVASMLLFRKYTTGRFAILQFTERLFKQGPGKHVYLMHEKARPDSSHAINEAIADESFHAYNFAYEPWMMFRIADFHSEHVNVNGFERNSSPNQFINTSSKDTIDIFFFGGSGMYGYNVADAETIPSAFVKIVQKNNPVKSVRVRNFGIPLYYSKQELILLSSLIFSGNKPDIVVFLDGMDDFYPARKLYYDRPHFSYALQQAFEGKMAPKGDRSFTDSTTRFYDLPPGVDPTQYNSDLYSKYINNLKSASLLCEKTGVKSYFFCQPVPFYKFNAPDSSAFKPGNSRFNDIYPMLERNSDSLKNFVFLGNMLQNETAGAFIDGLNYSPAFTQKIASALFDTIKTELQ